MVSVGVKRLTAKRGKKNFKTMIDTNTKLPFLSLLLCLISFQTALATEIKASLDRNPISINESVQLIFSATESPDDVPDFSPLKKDFEILNKTQRSNSSWINGKYSKSIQWILNLMPKKTGELLIPSISFGDDISQTAKLTVTKSKAANSTNNNAELFLEVETTPKSPYVQSQVLYTLKLFSRVQLAQASLSELEIPDALVEKLGEVKKYNTTRNGIEYTVNELNYAIFPQKSGKITINPLVLTADVVTSSRARFNGFFNRQMSKTKRVSSNAITLNVQTVPNAFKGKRWLPASQLVIEEKWSGETDQMKVGEPLTRTLTLLAVGNTVAQLPELHHKTEIEQLKTYPDQPVLKEQKEAEGLIAFREEKIAYIPSKAGSYTLPAIEIPWFNTQTQTMEIARIAERTVTAIAGGIASQKNSPPIESPKQEKTIALDSINSDTITLHTEENKLWMWLSIILACGWLLTILFMLSQRKPKQPPTTDNSKEIKLKETIKALKQACTANNALDAKNALLAWGNINYDSNTLSAIASHCEARLRDEILLLNQNLYANQADPWQGKKLFQTFTENKARKKVAKKADDDALEPLYKV
jgi:hypothetical protein